MGWLDKFKEVKEALSGGAIPNPYGIPAPGEFSTLMLSSPEEIITQYLSMQDKTQSLYEYSKSTGSISDYGNATMRYAAYSSVALFGTHLFFVNDENNVRTLVPENLNKLLYGKVLFDIADFSWLMLVFCFSQQDQTADFGEENIQKYLNLEHIPRLYWTLVFGFLVNQTNADYAYGRHRSYIEKLELVEPEKLEDLPSKTTKLAFDEMVECGLIGNPNEYRLFDAQNMLSVISSGPLEIERQAHAIRNSTICKLLDPEVKLHLVRGY